MAHYGRWKPYVSVAKRRAQAQRKMAALRKKGVDIQPVQIEGRKIARTYWGEAWCNHLESFSDYANRLPRGRTYVRNGSVCHLAIKKGSVEAKVSGSEIYAISVKINTLSTSKWKAIKKQCSGQIGSLLELLQGNLSNKIMSVVADRKDGMFPQPAEITFDCDCPDWARMCKHVAAVLYGIGARLDEDPSLLFLLRGVKHEELIDFQTQVAVPTGTGDGTAKRLATDNLGDVFGIDLADDSDLVSPKAKKSASRARARSAPKATAKKKTAVKKKAAKKKAAKKATVSKATSAKAKTKTSKRKSASPKSPAKTKRSASASTSRAAAKNPVGSSKNPS